MVCKQVFHWTEFIQLSPKKWGGPRSNRDSCVVITKNTWSVQHISFWVSQVPGYKLNPAKQVLPGSKYLSLPPTRQDLTRGQKPEGRLKVLPGSKVPEIHWSMCYLGRIISKPYPFLSLGVGRLASSE